MKKAMAILAVIFFVSVVFNPICFAQGDKGKGKGKAKGPTHEEFVAMYDRDGNGEESEPADHSRIPVPTGPKG